jgi:hypothetical protein
MADYRLTSNANVIIRNADGAFIPNDPDNRDRAEYDAWVAAGNTVDPYVPPPPPPVTQVTCVQGRIALLNAGLLDQAQAAVTAAGGATAIWWQYATNWERSNSLLNSLGATLGLTSTQIDQLFIAASQVQ